jgi:hypothetical protein
MRMIGIHVPDEVGIMETFHPYLETLTTIG